MEVNFSLGINTKEDPINMPPGHYLDAENMRFSGNALVTEEGMVQLGVPADFIQWGDCSIGDETILLGSINGASIIGSLNANNEWKVEVNPRAGADILQINEPTQVEGKKNWAGERVIYFANSAGARRINLDTLIEGVSDSDFDKITSLFLEYDLPRVTYVGESATGENPSGVYQFAARLVTDSGASTPFGIMSNVIPVVPGSLQASRESIMGAPPQTPTNKAINLAVSNVDATFKYIEFGVLTYVGDSNTPVVKVTNKVPINGQTNIKYTYRGESDTVKTIPIEEFILSGVSYSAAKFLTQKDGALIVGAPTEASQPPIDWYRVAANIESKFVVKLIPYKESLNFVYSNMHDPDKFNLKETSSEPLDQGYKNPMTCTLYKTYRRNEVYAFTLTPVFTSGVLGPTVHIPSNHNVATSAINATGDPNDGGTLGTYISMEKYVDSTYPGITSNDGLRLHKFPSAITQPLIEGNVETNNMNIRILGVEFSNIVLDASELQYSSQIAGYIIGSVNRKGNETQLAQGIVRPHTATKYKSQDAFCTLLGDGFVSFYGDTKDVGNYSSVGVPILTDFNFIAPDLIHRLYDINDGSHIAQHAVYKAKPYYRGFHTRVSSTLGGDRFATPKTFFKNIVGETSKVTQTALDTTPVELEGTRVKVEAFGVPSAPSSKGGKKTTTILRGSKSISMCSSDGFVWLGSKVPIKYYRPTDFLYRSVDTLTYDSSSSRKALCEPTQATADTTAADNYRTDFVVHTLVRVNDKQYGPLDQMVSTFVEYVPAKGFTGTVKFFNGDTFINKYGLTLNDESDFPWSSGDTGDSGRQKPLNANGIVYFWLESSNNYDYKHYVIPSTYSEDNVSSSKGTVPFFPAYKQLASAEKPLGLLSMYAENWVRPGYASQYNNQYSAKSTIKPYAVTPKEDIDRKASLVNRIIYSATSVQGEKSDAYQVFLPNNYYDVPQEYGELTDVYTLGELYASTKQIQWRLFFNTLTTQLTNVGEVVLGTGGAFNRPAIPMTSVDGGYGGTSHWMHAINTVYGRVFVDREQGKIFILQENIMSISDVFDVKYKEEIQKIPFEQILVGSEPLHDRVFIRLGDKMWSYELQRKAFASRHTYLPRWMFSSGPHLFSNMGDPALGDTGIFKHSEELRAVFYGQTHPSSVTLVARGLSQEFKSMEILTKLKKSDGTLMPFTTFSNVAVWTDERFSGINSLVYKSGSFVLAGVFQVLVSKVKDSFRFSIPRDIVKDPSISIFTPSNHYQVVGDTTPAEWLAKMKGNFLVIKLTTNNAFGQLALYGALVETTDNIR